MLHIHEKSDFRVALFVVHAGKVLLVHHRGLNKWLPVGGHIELDEDPEAAALREARESLGHRPGLASQPGQTNRKQSFSIHRPGGGMLS